ncbi:MAG TPA: hypothetical protein VHK91_16120 [Flavisolibacter sp.]|jgi:hypothetical protein|nr:hypothetical protein [Flavisolibacter sp.]
MKLLSLIASLYVLALPQRCQHQKPAAGNCLKGRLEIKGICSNYTIKVVSGNLDTSLLEKTWRDPQTGKTYSDVFGLGSRCSFPDSLKEGDEFYFKIDSSYLQHCMVCMAYYPTPGKHVNIKVLPGPCP